ncbi:GDYXXLXY domain-containing protein [Ideonella sp. A 288]|uniref:GDYXXLXY domain-containing protein n=1 Tax=Ideonella sp. A 288 TaxID=1962181 RepID=UPI000B4BA7E9|nr:GDYXXLXY domain-containing protein [Ideonella sp. A 288]
MTAPRLDAVLRAAIDNGLLPPTATPPAPDARPWPVVLLTALGAWLAAVPLLGVVGLLFGDLIGRSAGPYLAGGLVLAGALVVLRSSGVSAFAEQLAVPALLVGGGGLGFGLFRDLPDAAAAALLAALALAVAAGVAQAWLRALLGAAAAALLAVACLRGHWGAPQSLRLWLAWHLALALWLLATAVQQRALVDGARARLAALLESVSTGWVLATLAGLAWWSGMAFLVGGSLGGGLPGEVLRSSAMRTSATVGLGLAQGVSLLLALAAAAWTAHRWPAVRRPWLIGVAAALLVLAWFMPALGAVLLVLAACATSARWRRAAAAALAAVWTVGAFYYTLAWPLSTKAVVLVAAGAVLGALAWWAGRADRRAGPPPPASAAAPRGDGLGPRLAIAASALLALAVANVGAWQKENLIADGQPVFVELAPADPRSLMQGDFMRLNFRVPDAVQATADGLLTGARPVVVARRDGRGVATLLRVDDGRPLAADELRLQLTPKDGRWIVVTDAWFFREGEAARWAAAKYGEFRVEPGGRALLVGLRGEGLAPL